MYITAITCCVNYADFLSWFLLFNKAQFNRLIVATTSTDIRTQEVCAYYHVECLVTDVFYDSNQVFGKAEGINAILQKLQDENYAGWICHLDSDIVLPPRTMDFVRSKILHTPNALDCIYGIDRFKVVGITEWVDYLSSIKPLYEQEVWLRTDRFPLFPRVFTQGHWLPIGYYQLWHSSVCTHYPTVHENAARADMLFALQWTPAQRHLIGTAVAYHLESELTDMGVNWHGRTTAEFKLPAKEYTEKKSLFSWLYKKLW